VPSSLSAFRSPGPKSGGQALQYPLKESLRSCVFHTTAELQVKVIFHPNHAAPVASDILW